jgi:hypothetical protein
VSLFRHELYDPPAERVRRISRREDIDRWLESKTIK